MKTPYKMKGMDFGNSPLPNNDVETKTKSTKRVDRSRSRLLSGGDPSELTYTTKAGDKVEAIDIKKKTKKGKSGNTKRVNEVVIHDGGNSKTRRTQRVTRSGKVKTKNITWRDGKRVVTRTISDKIDETPILNYKKGYYGV